MAATAGLWWLTLDPEQPRSEAPLAQNVPKAPLPEAVPRSAAVAAATNDEEPVASTLEDVYLACDGLLHTVLPDYRALRDGTALAAPDCLAALDGLFLGESASSALLPVSPPLRWRDLFNDVAGDISAVVAAADDPDCAVPEGNIRPELGAACAARPLAELATLAHACGHILLGAFDTPGKDRWDDVVLKTPGGLPVSFSRTSHLYANYDRDGQARQRMVDQYAASSPDQQSYWHNRRREDEKRFRTAWLASKCVRHGGSLAWMADRPRLFDDMMARAARLGDSFALAHDVGTPERARRLLAIDPAQAYLHLAVLESNRLHDEWSRKARAVENETEKPYFDVRRRYLALAGVECPDPCSEENLRALETEHERTVWRWRARCYRQLPEPCPLAEKIEAMREALAPARRAAAPRLASLREEYLGLTEAARLKYVIAAEAVAAAAGVESRGHHYANPERPEHLDSHGVHLARVAARAMIAEHQARLGAGGSSHTSAPP